MLSHLTILFPCIASAIWFLVFLTRSGKSTEYMHLAILSGLTAAFFFVDAYYIMNGVSTRTLILADVLKQFIAPSMGLFCWHYFKTLQHDSKVYEKSGYLIAIPTFMMALSGISYLIMGYADADSYIRAYEATGSFPKDFDEPIFVINKIVNYDLYNLVEYFIVGFLVVFLIRGLVKSGFSFRLAAKALFKGESAPLIHIQSINFLFFLGIFITKIILGREYLTRHEFTTMCLNTVLGFIILLICFAGLTGSNEPVTLKKIYVGEDPEESGKSSEATPEEEKNPEQAPEETPEEETEEDEEEDINDDDVEEDNMGDDGIEDDIDEDGLNEPGHVSTIKYDESLVDKFRVAVVEKKLYLKNGLTIKDVCEELGSNKTYISKMVNERFGMPFPNFINMLRVDYAKQYLLSHPDAKQEEVADECGFPNAAGFNRSFKKETGTTPRIWLAKNRK